MRVRDEFEEDLPAGAVIGSRASDGTERLGKDRERTIAVDHGALRIQHLERPGWGKESIAYGPFPRRPGLALGVHMLNGHNASEPHERPSHPLIARGQRVLRRVRPPADGPELNLAVGWFPRARVTDPARGSHAFVMASEEARNGDLATYLGRELAPLVLGVMNLPIYFVVILREQGAAFYASSWQDAPGFAPYPHLRPLAIDPAGTEPELFAGVHQRVLGQAGWSIDSRVYGIHAEQLPELAAWYGTAHAADGLTGTGRLDGGGAEAGGPWTVAAGGWERTPVGARANAEGGSAMLHCEAPTGLLHVLLERTAVAGGILFRAGGDTAWQVLCDRSECTLALGGEGSWTTIARERVASPPSGGRSSLLVADDGHEIEIRLDGRALFGGPIADERLAEAHGVGLCAAEGIECPTLARFEAHPRQLSLPAPLDPRPPWQPPARIGRVLDRFDGEAGELERRRDERERPRWRRRLGVGTIERLGGTGGRVRASLGEPNPGRTIYTTPWDWPEFAELELEQTPPGSSHGEGEMGRCGLLFWTSELDYLIVNVWLDDKHDSASISTFLMLDGREDHYRAVWSNIGRAIRWGVRSRLRVAFDGLDYAAWVDDRPVLYRAITDARPEAQRLPIAEVGIIVNWEYGDDTGTLLHCFSAASGVPAFQGGLRS